MPNKFVPHVEMRRMLTRQKNMKMVWNFLADEFIILNVNDVLYKCTNKILVSMNI
jgi:hypothetical protein